jgi:hypothetical protein
LDTAREREIRAIRRRLEALLSAREVDAFGVLLREEADKDLLEVLRERKLVLRGSPEDRQRVRALLIEAGRRTLIETEAGAFERQLDLMLLIEYRTVDVQLQLRKSIAQLPPLRLRDLLAIADKAFGEITREMVNPTSAWSDPERTVALAEREWQDMNGLLADIMFATCRAVNEIAKENRPSRRLRPEKRGTAVRRLKAIVSIASELNALEWVADSVAFGDLDVEEISATERPTVKLGHRRPRHSLLRTLAMRRSLVMEQFARRADRFVREWLRSNLEACLPNAILGYEDTTQPALLHSDIMTKALERIEIYLNTIDFEDDMVVVAAKGDREVIGRYLLAGMLRAHVIASELVADQLPRSRRREFLPARIELAEITHQVSEHVNADVLARAWSEQTVVLPAASHWELLRRPFVRDGHLGAMPIVHGSSGKWNADVRERLVQGGVLAKNLGGLWEDRFADRFQESGWTVLGRGVRLKEKGRLLTDLDLLLLREDLLLVAQVKALGGSPMNPYDHWRQTKVIEKGCRQAALALEHLRRDLSLIQAVASRRVAEKVTHVEAVVLTNSGVHEGWEHLAIPVLGETLLKAITVGSRVEYVDSQTKRVISTKHFIRPEELDTPTIVAAMRMPVELKIATETGAVFHVPEHVANVTFLRPEFVVGGEAPDAPRLRDVARVEEGT